MDPTPGPLVSNAMIYPQLACSMEDRISAANHTTLPLLIHLRRSGFHRPFPFPQPQPLSLPPLPTPPLKMHSTVRIVEEQLDVSLRLLLGYSASITPEEIKSICSRLSFMYHTMGHMLVMKTLESNGVAQLGEPSSSLHRNYGELQRLIFIT